MAETNVISLPVPAASTAAKFRVTAVLDGFPVEVEYEGKATDLAALIAKLKAIGAQPPAQTTAPKTDPHICPTHQKPLKRGRWGFYCPRTDDQGRYCTYTVKE
jgi:hypothetical protein